MESYVERSVELLISHAIPRNIVVRDELVRTLEVKADRDDVARLMHDLQVGGRINNTTIALGEDIKNEIETQLRHIRGL